MGGAKKKVQKIIPKEIKPALPYIAAFYGGPALSGLASSGTGALAKLVANNPAFAKALVAGGTQGVMGGDIKDIGRAAVLAAAPDVVGGQLMKADPKFLGGSKFQDILYKTGEGIKNAGALKTIGAQTSIEGAQQLKEINEQALRDYNQQLQDQGIRDKAARRKSIFDIYVGAGYDSEYVNSVLDKYGYAEGGRVEGIMSVSPELMKGMSLRDLADLAKRIKDAEEDKKRENKRQGGRVGFKLGGGEFSLISVLLDRINPDTGEKYTPEEAEEVVSGMRGVDTSDIMQGIQGIQSGFETAMGEPIFGQRPQPMGIVPGFGNLPRMNFAQGGTPNVMAIRKTIAELIASGVIDEEDVEKIVSQLTSQGMMSMRPTGMAEGGLMSLRAGGMPAEMDMRGGGFIPIGRKERADDVPARLSKNEFVMTADAVRGAGGGSIEKGAKRMYQTMKRLEAKS